MGGRIPEAFIDELLGRLDIVDVVGDRVQLRPAGHEYKALCPFHEERTPSFTVSPQKQFYHCFGCGAHGSAIGFLMQHDGLEFVDAVEELAHSIGMEVPREGGSGAGVDARLYQAVAAAAAFYRGRLREHEPAQRYLAGRDIEAAAIERFELGYAPEAWHGVDQHLRGKGFSEGEIAAVGLLAGEGERRYDRFRNRLMFPIHDRRGRPIAFGGRNMGELGPKYLNSPDTALFHKGRELYGLYQARKQRPERLFVVEGYTDVIALSQAGLAGAVATLGTATTQAQARLLFQAAAEVVFCFDGDPAGRQAAWKALQAVLAEMRAGRQARFLFLPEGEDPDSLVRGSGLEAFTALAAAAESLSTYFFRELERGLDVDSTEGRAALIARAEEYIGRLPAGHYRDLLYEQLRERSGHWRLAASTPSPRPRRAAGPGLERTPMRLAIALLVQDPGLAARVEPAELEFHGAVKGIEVLQELIDFCRQRPHITAAQVIEHWRGQPGAKWLGSLAGWSVAEDADKRLAEFRGNLRRLQRAGLASRIDELYEIQRATRLTPEQKTRLRDLLAAKQRLDAIEERNGAE